MLMMDTQATDVVTFDFKGTGIRCVVCGTIDYQMNFFLVHNVSKCSRFLMTSSPKGNDAHLRATIQSEKKWIDQFVRCLRAAYSVVRGRIWLNFKLIQALKYVIITCKYEKFPIKNNREKVATPFFKS